MAHISVTVESSKPDDAEGDGILTGDVDGQDGYTVAVYVTDIFEQLDGGFFDIKVISP